MQQINDVNGKIIKNAASSSVIYILENIYRRTKLKIDIIQKRVKRRSYDLILKNT